MSYSTSVLKTGRGGDLVLPSMTPALGTLGENRLGLSLLATVPILPAHPRSLYRVVPIRLSVW